MSITTGFHNMGPGATHNFTPGQNFPAPDVTAGTTCGTSGTTAPAHNLAGPLHNVGTTTTMTGLTANGGTGEHAGIESELHSIGLTTVTANGGGSDLDGTLADHLQDRNI